MKMSISRLWQTIATRACPSESAYFRMTSALAFGIVMSCRSTPRNDRSGRPSLEPVL